MSKKFQLKNVRLSFPSLFQKETFKGAETENNKYTATFIIPNDNPVIKEIKEHISERLKEVKINVSTDKVSLKDGNTLARKEYQNAYVVKASTKKRPVTVNVDKSTVVEEDGLFYAGCYVDAIIDFWIQNNTYGKRVNANLYGVRFLKDGEPFGDLVSTENVISMFADIDEHVVESTEDFF